MQPKPDSMPEKNAGSLNEQQHTGYTPLPPVAIVPPEPQYPTLPVDGGLPTGDTSFAYDTAASEGTMY